jgi:hypothetical protein
MYGSTIWETLRHPCLDLHQYGCLEAHSAGALRSRCSGHLQKEYLQPGVSPSSVPEGHAESMEPKIFFGGCSSTLCRVCTHVLAFDTASFVNRQPSSAMLSQNHIECVRGLLAPDMNVL